MIPHSLFMQTSCQPASVLVSLLLSLPSLLTLKLLYPSNRMVLYPLHQELALGFRILAVEYTPPLLSQLVSCVLCSYMDLNHHLLRNSHIIIMGSLLLLVAEAVLLDERRSAGSQLCTLNCGASIQHIRTIDVYHTIRIIADEVKFS